MKPRPAPPRPNSIRKPVAGFGWLDARLLRDRWLPELGPDAIAVLAFLALAADRDGVSYYARDRIAVELDIDLPRLDRALQVLLDAALVAHRPWRNGRLDGVWQILPVPHRSTPNRTHGLASAETLLREMGFRPPNHNRGS